MIIRIFGEGQYEIEDGAMPRLNQLDRDVQAAMEAGDEERFHSLFSALLGEVRAAGSPLADDDLRGSDLMLPQADVTLEEARAEIPAEGLIPD